ncbi:MAG: SH3 domain-containing protein [Methylobacterium frigidaeris]
MPKIRAAALLLALLAPAVVEAAPDMAVGSATKLPIPRYVSLKTDRVNLREGPSKDHRTLWVFQRAGLPVEIVSEFETWRRIRDSEGTEGWVLHSLLSGRRTAIVLAKGDKAGPTALHAGPEGRGDVVAQLQAGVIGSVKSCTGSWCRLVVSLPQKRGDVDGYVRQDSLWGVYPNEKVE